jgi:ATP-dependent RNA helicase RhlE
VEEGYVEPTQVQREVIPLALAGRDILAAAQTGTGKTAAFVLPILHLLSTADEQGQGPSRFIRALVLTPTRELATQIAERVAAYSRHIKIRYTVVHGGVSQRPQERALQRGVDVLVATPGRLLDLMQQGFVDLRAVKAFVLDEADRMLDMGFIHDVRRISSALPTRQTLLFSATIPKPIETLANGILQQPARISVQPTLTTAEKIDQSVMFVARADKRAVLERLLHGNTVVRAIVFTRTKHGADRLSRQLVQSGIETAAMHGDRSQAQRDRALESFRLGRTRVLVATDVASRGIDVDGITHVFNYDLPNVAENYVHRIGRTGRAGAHGEAISLVDREERGLLRDIERLIRRKLDIVENQGD